MKLTLETNNFVDAVMWATKSFDAKDEKSYVVLSVDEDGVGKLIHVNQSSYMSAPLSIETSDFSNDNESSALIALDGNFLQRLAGSISKFGGDIVLSKSLDKKNQPLSAKVGTSKFTIPVLRLVPDDEPELTKVGDVNDQEFFDTLQRLAKLCSPASADSGLATRSVALNLDEENIIGMATDSYSLGEITIDYTPTKKKDKLEFNIVLIPSNVATMITPSKDSSAMVDLVYDKSSKKFGYRFADNRLALFSLDQASPIIYEELKANVQSSVEHSVTIDSRELRNAIGTISSLAWDEVDVKIQIDGENNIIRVTDENENNKIELNAHSMDFDEIDDITFMRMTINQAFSPISTELLRLSFSNSESACILEPILDDGSVDENVFALAIPST